VLAHVFPPDERPKAIAIWAAFAGVGAGLGGVTSGWLLQHFWWGSIFLTNVFVVVIALVAGFFLVPSANEKRRAPLDLIGALLSIAGLAALVYGIIEAPDQGWTSADARDLRPGPRDPGQLRGWELRADEPMLDLGYFRNLRFTARPPRSRWCSSPGLISVHPVPAVRPRLLTALGGHPDPAGRWRTQPRRRSREAGRAVRPADGGGIGPPSRPSVAPLRLTSSVDASYCGSHSVVVQALAGHHHRPVDRRDHAIAAPPQGGVGSR
jgi:hypothetical protein